MSSDWLDILFISIFLIASISKNMNCPFQLTYLQFVTLVRLSAWALTIRYSDITSVAGTQWIKPKKLIWLSEGSHKMKDSKVIIDWLINRLIDGFIQSRRRADVQASLLSWPRIMNSISFVLAWSFFFHSWQPNMIRMSLLKFWQTSNYFFAVFGLMDQLQKQIVLTN